MTDMLKNMTDWHNDNGIPPIILRDVHVGQKQTFGTRVIPKLSTKLSSFDTERLNQYSGLKMAYKDSDDHDYTPIYFIHRIDKPKRPKDEFVGVYLSTLNGEDSARVERATMMTVMATQPIRVLMKKSTLALLRLLSGVIPNYNSLDVFDSTGERLFSVRFPHEQATRLWGQLHSALVEITEPQFAYDSNQMTPGGVPLYVREIQSDLSRLVHDILYRDSVAGWNRFFDKYDSSLPRHVAGENPNLPIRMADKDTYHTLFSFLQVMLGYSRVNSMNRDHTHGAGVAQDSGTMVDPDKDHGFVAGNEFDEMFASMLEFNGLGDKDEVPAPGFLDSKKQWGNDQPPIGDILPFAMVPIVALLETSEYSAALDYMRLDVAGNSQLRNHIMANTDNSQHVLARILVLQVIGYMHNMLENRKINGKSILAGSIQGFIHFTLNTLLGEDSNDFGWEFLTYVDDFCDHDDYKEFQSFIEFYSKEKEEAIPYSLVGMLVFLDRFLSEGWDISSLNDMDIPEGHSNALKTFLLNILDIVESDGDGFIGLEEQNALPTAAKVLNALQRQPEFKPSKITEILPVGILTLAKSNITSLDDGEAEEEKRQYLSDLLFNMALSMAVLSED